MDAAAVARGRTLTRTSLASSSGLAAALGSTDVLFVPRQNTDEATMTTVASFWHDPLVAFVAAGGVVVVLTGGAVWSLYGYEWRIVAAPDLFSLPAAAWLGGLTNPVIVEIVDATDPIAAGVLSPFPTLAGTAACFPGSSGGRLVARTAGTMLCPVVRHLVR